ncbi:MAG: M1 family metallopeptidase [Clostridia bacterium]|nr:M1 family metallopeptidase [Clostridia bacterium]
MKDTLTREEQRRAWQYAAYIVAGLIAIAALVLWGGSLPFAEKPGTLPPTDAAVLAAAEGLDHIAVDAVFDPESRQLTAIQTMTLTNRTGEAHSAVMLRSYSGAYLSQDTSPAATEELFDRCYYAGFSTGGLLTDSAQVNGVQVDHAYDDDARTVLRLPLETPWQPGETVTVTLAYHVYIPSCAGRFGVSDGVWSLGNVFPTPAVWEDGAWRTDAYIAIGDPFVTECANWRVRLTVPAGYTAVGTGYAEPYVQGDARVYDMLAQSVRDFALVISDRWQMLTGMADDTMLIACARDRDTARDMLRYARQAIVCYEAHWGDYVYPTLTLTETAIPFSGMEYPRLLMLGAASGQTLEFAVAHEVAHQWWYAMVGSDPVHQAWQDESLCEYALMDYIGRYYGADSRASAAFQRIETAMRITIPRGVTPGSPIDYFADLTEYTQVVYRRGASLWMALETMMGKDTLDAALSEYRRTYCFSTASRADLTEILSRFAGRDLTALMVDYLDTEMN